MKLYMLQSNEKVLVLSKSTNRNQSVKIYGANPHLYISSQEAYGCIKNDKQPWIEFAKELYYGLHVKTINDFWMYISSKEPTF